MWIANLILRHDCLLGNRCRKFNVMLQSIVVSEEKAGKQTLTHSIHQMLGKAGDMRKFVVSLKKDRRVKYLEVNEQTLFLVESAPRKPVLQFSQKMFFVKPVLVDADGYEHWEIASHDKRELMRFLASIRPHLEYFELKKLKQTKLKDIYFPKLMPDLTGLQKLALELAVRSGYYSVPKRTTLRKLAAQFGVSLATYQKHLQKAESKIIPDVLSLLK